jgi:hypothetical protein
MAQVTIILKESEKVALILLADQERRKLQDMAGMLVREGLERRGMIEPFPILKRPEHNRAKEAVSNSFDR